MHAHYQHLLVIRPVEDADLTALGELARGAPEEIVLQFLGRGRLERKHLAALRIDSRHDVLDRPIFAGRVQRLQDHKNRPAVLGVEHVLQLRHARDAILQSLLRVLFRVPLPGIGGIKIL